MSEHRTMAAPIKIRSIASKLYQMPAIFIHLSGTLLEILVFKNEAFKSCLGDTTFVLIGKTVLYKDDGRPSLLLDTNSDTETIISGGLSDSTILLLIEYTSQYDANGTATEFVPVWEAAFKAKNVDNKQLFDLATAAFHLGMEHLTRFTTTEVSARTQPILDLYDKGAYQRMLVEIDDVLEDHHNIDLDHDDYEPPLQRHYTPSTPRPMKTEAITATAPQEHVPMVGGSVWSDGVRPMRISASTPIRARLQQKLLNKRMEQQQAAAAQLRAAITTSTATTTTTTTTTSSTVTSTSSKKKSNKKPQNTPPANQRPNFEAEYNEARAKLDSAMRDIKVLEQRDMRTHDDPITMYSNATYSNTTSQYSMVQPRLAPAPLSIPSLLHNLPPMEISFDDLELDSASTEPVVPIMRSPMRRHDSIPEY